MFRGFGSVGFRFWRLRYFNDNVRVEGFRAEAGSYEVTITSNWVAVKELKLGDYPPIMENQMEKKMENEMETGGIQIRVSGLGFRVRGSSRR